MHSLSGHRRMAPRKAKKSGSVWEGKAGENFVTDLQGGRSSRNRREVSDTNSYREVS